MISYLVLVAATLLLWLALFEKLPKASRLSLLYLSTILHIIFAFLISQSAQTGFRYALIAIAILLALQGPIALKAYARSQKQSNSQRSDSLVLLLLITLFLLADSFEIGSILDTSSLVIVINVLAVSAAQLAIFRICRANLQSSQPLKKLPSITIAIPARNETHILTQSLDAISDLRYPKLEILVLDDCSQDTTPTIIKSFASKGIRFLAGESGGDEWLGKNFAYQQLFEEASGEYILFVGVDVRFNDETLIKMVNTAVQQDRKMVNVMPQRKQSGVGAHLLQPIRYIWQLLSPFSKPALSSFWLIERATMTAMGGFEKYKSSIIPEKELARDMAKREQYLFVLANNQLPITTLKKLSSQYSTAVRTYFPLLRSQLWLSSLALLLLSGLLASWGWSIFQVFTDNNDLATSLGLAGLVSLGAMHLILLVKVNGSTAWLFLLQWPLAYLSTLALILISLIKYEFGSVEWKGRNICIPVIQRPSR